MINSKFVYHLFDKFKIDISLFLIFILRLRIRFQEKRVWKFVKYIYICKYLNLYNNLYNNSNFRYLVKNYLSTCVSDKFSNWFYSETKHLVNKFCSTLFTFFFTRINYSLLIDPDLLNWSVFDKLLNSIRILKSRNPFVQRT